MANIKKQIQTYCTYLNTWNASYEAYAKSQDLSYTGLSVLSRVLEKDGCTQKQLSQDCFLPKQTVNVIITSFLKKGWIVLKEIPTDRRNKTIHFTEEGFQKATQIVSNIRKSEQEAMSLLDDTQREQLLALTKIYVEGCENSLKKK